MYQFSRSIYRELAPDILEDRPSTAGTEQPRARAARLRGRGLPPGHGPPLLRAGRRKTLFNDIRIYFPMSSQRPRLPRRRPLHDVRPRVLRGPDDRRLRPRRQPARVPRDDAQGHAVPAHAAAAQRLLPVAPAPRRDRRAHRSTRQRRSMVARLDRRGDEWRACASASSGWGSWARARRRTWREPATSSTVFNRTREKRRGVGGGARRHRRRLARARPPSGADVVITMVVDGAAGRGRCCSARTAPPHGAARGHAVRRHVDDRARPTRAASAATLDERGPRLRRRPRHRLVAQGRGRHADDHVRRQRRGHGARAAAARGDGREDRPRRRGRPGPGGQGASPTRSAPINCADARPGAGGRPPRRRRPRRAARGDGRRLGQLDDARSSRASRCSSTTSRRCSSSSTCSRTSGCASTRRARPARAFPFAALARRALQRRRRAAASASRTSRRCSRSSRASPTRASVTTLETRVHASSGIGPIALMCRFAGIF